MNADRGIARWEDGLWRTSRALASRAGQLARGPRARRLRDLTARHPGRAVIVLGTVGWLLGLVGAEGRPRATTAPTPSAPVAVAPRPVERATVPPEYVVLAGILADEWSTTRDAIEAPRSQAETIARLRNQALDLGRLEPADPDIAAVAVEGRDALVDGTASMERLLALPKPPGQWEVMGESFLRGFALDLRGLARQVDRLSAEQDAILAEARHIAAVVRRGEAATLMLPRIAARYAGPSHAGGPALAIDLDAAWGPVGPADWLTLTNSSGVDLHNATVLVEVRGEAGDAAPSVHFIPSWPAGAAIQAKYGHGDLVFDYASNRHTVPNVVAVAASLWSEELRQEGIAYAYAGAERDADVAPGTARRCGSRPATGPSEAAS